MIFKTVMKLYAVDLCKIPQPDVLYSYCCLQLPVTGLHCDEVEHIQWLNSTHRDLKCQSQSLLLVEYAINDKRIVQTY